MKTINNAFAVLTVCFFLLVGCVSTPIERYVNKNFPPVSIEKNQKESQENFAKNLSTLNMPTVAFEISTQKAKELLLTERLRSLGLTIIDMSSDEQIIKIRMDFDVDLSSFSQDKDIQKWKPKVKGSIQLYSGIAVNTQATTGEISIRLIPGLNEISIKSINIKDKYDVTTLGNILTQVVNNYADNISGELSKQEILNIQLPKELTTKFRLSDQLKDTEFGDGIAISLKDEEVNLGYQFSNATFALHKNKISGLIELYNPQLFQMEENPTIMRTDSKYKSIYGRYKEIQSTLFDGLPPVSPVWIGVRKDLISHLLTQSITQAQLCTQVIVNSTENFSDKIKLPDGGGISCDSSRDCTPTRNCDVSKSHDTRNCRRCLVNKPFGGCMIRGNDPLCEAAKAAQNAIYEADAVARKLDCERIKAQKKLACEAEKTIEINACKGLKEVVSAIGRTGNFANISAKVDIQANSNLCLTNATFSPNMSELRAGIRFSGQAKGDVAFKFTPLDIVGHLTCPFPWTDDYTIKANFNEQSIDLDAKLELSFDENKGVYKYSVAPMELEASMDPAPLNLLIDAIGSTNMNLACPIAGIVSSITIPLRGSLPPIDSNRKIPTPALSGQGSFALPLVKLNGDVTPIKIQNRQNALMFSL